MRLKTCHPQRRCRQAPPHHLQAQLHRSPDGVDQMIDHLDHQDRLDFQHFNIQSLHLNALIRQDILITLNSF